MTDERREYQRLNIGQPIDGWFGDWAVRLLDVSATGARIIADEPIPNASRALLRFWWRGTEVEITAETVRQDDTHSGIRFIEESAVLRKLLADEATALLRAQQANAMGERDGNVFGDETLTAASAVANIGYITYSLVDGRWKKRPALTGDQPANGFTISAGEPDEQIQLLCQTYEQGDHEARRLTRLLAELSVAR